MTSIVVVRIAQWALMASRAEIEAKLRRARALDDRELVRVFEAELRARRFR